jgi:hypothetical protein
VGGKTITTLYVVSYFMIDLNIGPLRYIYEKSYISSRVSRWHILLVEYDIVYMTRKAVKWSAIADSLADNAIKDYKSLDFEFLDEKCVVGLTIQKENILVDHVFRWGSKCIW